MKKKIILNIIFVITGAIAGYLYWRYVGCKSGTCPITSKWHNTMVYGSVFGYLIGSSILDLIYKKEKKNN